MSDMRRKRAEEIFQQAMDLPAADRAEFVRVQCGTDGALRSEVEALLTLTMTALGSFLASVGELQPDRQFAGEDPPIPQRIGQYAIIRKLGEGGMGIVYLAEQASPVKRSVAIKLLKVGHAARELVARFDSERQALAMMNHPNIAAVYDAGATEDGRPYFAMEYVDGDRFTEHCDKQRLTIPERLRLFIQVCAGVQHAHQKGVIHRDIKPSNVLVMLQSDVATPKVIDFGVARLTAPGLQQQPGFTQHGMMIGTPEYMSPEQVTGALDIDTRTDVYGLGVLLYECLTGAPPFDSKRLHSVAYDELQRIIREQDPPTPSTRLSDFAEALPAIATARRVNSRKLGSLVRGELDWIVMKCLEKDRARRYESAGALAQDIERFLRGEPVMAAPPSRLYLIRKFVRRNRGIAIGSSLVIAALLLGLGGTTWGVFWALQERARAEGEASAAKKSATAEAQARTRAVTILEFVSKALRSSDPSADGRQDTTIAEAMTSAVRELDAGAFKDDPETEAGLKATIAQILVNNGKAAQAEPLAEQALEVLRRLFPGDHPLVAANLQYLGHCEDSLGHFAEALTKHIAALEMRERLFRGDHPDVADSLNNVAYCLHSLDSPKEALPKYEAALAMYQRLFPQDRPEVANSLNNVAACLLSLDRSAEALSKCQAGLEMRQRLFKRDHPDVANSLNMLAVCLRETNRHADALPLNRAALEMRQRLYQGDHPALAQSLNNLALCLVALGRYDEALPLHEAAAEMRKRLFPGDNADKATTLHNLAYCLHLFGRRTEAIAVYEEALSMRQRLFHGDDANVAHTLNNLAACLRSEGRLEEALLRYEASLDMQRRALPAGHPNILYPQLGLTRTLVALHRFDDAESRLLDAADQCQRFSEIQSTHWQNVVHTSVELYDAWHAAEPDKGYDAKAAEWRAKLAEWQASTQPSTQPSSQAALP